MTTVSPYAVLNCSVTEILGFYNTQEEATTAATELGQCSFAYKLSPKELAALEAQKQPQEGSHENAGHRIQ